MITEEIDIKVIDKELISWNLTNEGKCWWVYQYIVGPVFKMYEDIEGF